MALLNMTYPRSAWLIIDIQPIELEPDAPDYGSTDGIKARVSFFPDANGNEFGTEFDTKDWQLCKLDFETIAYSLARAAKFAHTHFTVSYYGDEMYHPNVCTIHAGTPNINLLLRGIGLWPKRAPNEDSIQIHCFVHAGSGLYAGFCGNCSIAAAEQFGKELLRELDAVKEYDNN